MVVSSSPSRTSHPSPAVYKTQATLSDPQSRHQASPSNLHQRMGSQSPPDPDLFMQKAAERLPKSISRLNTTPTTSARDNRRAAPKNFLDSDDDDDDDDIFGLKNVEPPKDLDQIDHSLPWLHPSGSPTSGRLPRPSTSAATTRSPPQASSGQDHRRTSSRTTNISMRPPRSLDDARSQRRQTEGLPSSRPRAPGKTVSKRTGISTGGARQKTGRKNTSSPSHQTRSISSYPDIDFNLIDDPFKKRDKIPMQSSRNRIETDILNEPPPMIIEVQETQKASTLSPPSDEGGRGSCNNNSNDDKGTSDLAPSSLAGQSQESASSINCEDQSTPSGCEIVPPFSIERQPRRLSFNMYRQRSSHRNGGDPQHEVYALLPLRPPRPLSSPIFVSTTSQKWDRATLFDKGTRGDPANEGGEGSNSTDYEQLDKQAWENPSLIPIATDADPPSVSTLVALPIDDGIAPDGAYSQCSPTIPVADLSESTPPGTVTRSNRLHAYRKRISVHSGQLLAVDQQSSPSPHKKPPQPVASYTTPLTIPRFANASMSTRPGAPSPLSNRLSVANSSDVDSVDNLGLDSPKSLGITVRSPGHRPTVSDSSIASISTQPQIARPSLSLASIRDQAGCDGNNGGGSCGGDEGSDSDSKGCIGQQDGPLAPDASPTTLPRHDDKNSNTNVNSGNGSDNDGDGDDNEYIPFDQVLIPTAFKRIHARLQDPFERETIDETTLRRYELSKKWYAREEKLKLQSTIKHAALGSTPTRKPRNLSPSSGSSSPIAPRGMDTANDPGGDGDGSESPRLPATTSRDPSPTERHRQRVEAHQIPD
ncbi:hypothetical protein EV182_003045, partial [Spiromyces aspiralis]